MNDDGGRACLPRRRVSVERQVLEIWNVAQDPRQNIIPRRIIGQLERNKPQR